MIEKEYEVIIIGAGHSGLCLSYYLTQNKINHIVIEKEVIGNSWHTQRWDNFRMTTPNIFNELPGGENYFTNLEGYCTANEFIEYLKYYSSKYLLPIIENTEVIEVSKDSNTDQFLTTLKENDALKQIKTKQIVICSGSQNKKYIPQIAINANEKIIQLHSSQYKNYEQLNQGNVLVVGSGQSGVQIAEELALKDIKVFLSTSKVGRIPRRYKGKDIVEWLKIIGYYDITISELTDKTIVHNSQPQITSSGLKGRTLSLQALDKINVSIIGSIEKINGSTVNIKNNVTENIKYADDASKNIKRLIDKSIKEKNIEELLNEIDADDEPDDGFMCANDINSLDLENENIASIIWATGYKPNFEYIKLPVFNTDNSLLQLQGLTNIQGLYFLGLPWLHKRKSGIILGIKEDAEFILATIIKNLI
jgi:putative flavoprotein involved in K+ transport